MSDKKTVTVGIAAYNEENSIKKTLQQVLDQKSSGWTLSSVLVVSDGSTDATEAEVKKIKDSRIIFFEDEERKGKSQRLNEIMQRTKTDVLVLLDADIVILSDQILQRLLDPILNDSEVALVSGHIDAVPPKTFVQKVIRTGHMLWNKTREPYFGHGAYYCAGPIRALEKRLYSQLTFPKISSEDIYPYLYCMYHSVGKYVFVEGAKVFYKLPKTLTDYLKQMRRYLQSIPEQEEYFPDDFIRSQFIITRKMKIKTFFQEMIRSPFWVSCYAFFVLLSRLQDVFYYWEKNNSGVWQQVSSTKES